MLNNNYEMLYTDKQIAHIYISEQSGNPKKKCQNAFLHLDYLCCIVQDGEGEGVSKNKGTQLFAKRHFKKC
jgi:hypothetical protein